MEAESSLRQPRSESAASLRSGFLVCASRVALVAVSSETAAAAAAVHAAAAPSSASLAVAKVKPAPKQRRRPGRIDLDDRIAEAKVREAMAKAAVKAARNEAKNEKKRRARLVKKAAALSCEDLERVAKLKRSGL